MKSAASALHDAAIARLRSDPTGSLSALGIDSDRDITTDPGQTQALPYLVVGGNTGTEAVQSTTATGTDDTFTVTAWATSHPTALQLAEAALALLRDDTDPLSADGFQFLYATLDLLGPPFRNPGDASARPWGCPLRIRYRIYRTTAA